MKAGSLRARQDWGEIFTRNALHFKNIYKRMISAIKSDPIMVSQIGSLAKIFMDIIAALFLGKTSSFLIK